MKHKTSGSAVPRYDVFVLKDKTSVVRWATNHVQDLRTGQFLNYDASQFDHSITDDELRQLQKESCVEHFTEQFVWLIKKTSPQTTNETPQSKMPKSTHRIRSFYIDTLLPDSYAEHVQAVLRNTPFEKKLQVKIHNQTVAIYGQDDRALTRLQDTELILQQLRYADRTLFQQAFVAVLELAMDVVQQVMAPLDATVSLIPIDVSLTREKKVLIVGGDEQNQRALRVLLTEKFETQVIIYQNAHDAILFVEENPVDVMIVDLNLPDMHGWTFIKKIREIRSLSDLQIIVTSYNALDEVFALKVVKVTGFLLHPVDVKEIAEKVWMALYTLSTRS